jgi:hypothetical protein
MPDAGPDEAHTVADILQQVPAGLLHALANERQGGEVKDGVPGTVAEGGLHCIGIGEISFDQMDTRGDGLPVTLAEVVQHGDVGTAIMEIDHEMTADVAGAPSD